MSVRILHGDCRHVLPTLEPASVQCCVTSPPYYGLRDYGVSGQIGLEATPDEYVAQMVAVFREVKRVLRDDGVAWLNLGDSYAGGKMGRSDDDTLPRPKGGHREGAMPGYAQARPVPPGYKPKDLLGIPWRVAFALQSDGWWLRSAIVWAKPNPMPESVTDRPTSSYEMVFLLAKSERYFYDAEAVREEATPQERTGKVGYATPGHAALNAQGVARRVGGVRSTLNAASGDTRNLRNVWTIATQPYSGAHFATMPPDLAELCIKAGSKPGDTILDPFGGAGTTGLVADRLNRNTILIELNPEYRTLATDRITDDAPLFAEVV